MQAARGSSKALSQHQPQRQAVHARSWRACKAPALPAVAGCAIGSACSIAAAVPPLPLSWQHQKHHRLGQSERRPTAAAAAAAAFDAGGSSSSSSSTNSSGDNANAPPPPPPPTPPPKQKKTLYERIFAGFDRMPAQTQMVVLTVLGLTAFGVVPFLQPTFLYGSSQDGGAAGAHNNNVATVVPALAPNASKRARRAAERAAEAAEAAAAQAVADAEAAEALKLQRMRELPVAGPVLGYLQECAMPQKLPDGRTESPGATRIYCASLILLGFFYAASAVLQAIINVFMAALLKLGIIHVRRPPPSPAAGGAV